MTVTYTELRDLITDRFKRFRAALEDAGAAPVVLVELLEVLVGLLAGRQVRRSLGASPGDALKTFGKGNLARESALIRPASCELRATTRGLLGMRQNLPAMLASRN
jgi:hypothetical protein